jgi:hypothetical protein
MNDEAPPVISRRSSPFPRPLLSQAPDPDPNLNLLKRLARVSQRLGRPSNGLGWRVEGRGRSGGYKGCASRGHVLQVVAQPARPLARDTSTHEPNPPFSTHPPTHLSSPPSHHPPLPRKSAKPATCTTSSPRPEKAVKEPLHHTLRFVSSKGERGVDSSSFRWVTGCATFTNEALKAVCPLHLRKGVAWPLAMKREGLDERLRLKRRLKIRLKRRSKRRSKRRP